MPVRMRIDGLWGTHLRVDQWFAKTGQASSFRDESYAAFSTATTGRYPFLQGGSLKSHYREFPFTGMSCAIFELPPSTRVTIMGGGQTPGWRSDNHPDDVHYSFRAIRTTVRVPAEH